MEVIAGLIQTSFIAGGVLAPAAPGEVRCDGAGVVNLGVEGLVALGAVTGIAALVDWPAPAFGLAMARPSARSSGCSSRWPRWWCAPTRCCAALR